MELEGISKACKTNVMMNSPVTSTAASEARNSTVVSRGFSSFGGLLSFLDTESFSFWRFFRSIELLETCGPTGSFGTNESPHRRSA